MKKIIKYIPLALLVIHLIFFKNYYQDEFTYQMLSLAIIFLITLPILIHSFKKDIKSNIKTKLILLSVSLLITLAISFFRLT
ncbi:hypothetical protein KAOT1_18237 [Kordia algicida OT-1]|uniref:Uncharacterized protein n=1 Tax=Kordia algicida OT-1 TaxID=391587 RepID=A9DN75_9FLAO|nr:hypothetical protein KAOT1_18237 [Kordia algicida OT-1]